MPGGVTRGQSEEALEVLWICSLYKYSLAAYLHNVYFYLCVYVYYLKNFILK